MKQNHLIAYGHIRSQVYTIITVPQFHCSQRIFKLKALTVEDFGLDKCYFWSLLLLTLHLLRICNIRQKAFVKAKSK